MCGRRSPDALGTPRPAVEAYILQLSTLAADDPRLLVAHAYTQHLALLAGGQIVAKTVRKQLMLPLDEGTAAYHFTVCLLWTSSKPVACLSQPQIC